MGKKTMRILNEFALKKGQVKMTRDEMRVNEKRKAEIAEEVKIERVVSEKVTQAIEAEKNSKAIHETAAEIERRDRNAKASSEVKDLCKIGRSLV